MNNDIILLDGVRYCRYSPKSENEFRQLIVDNIAELFGKEAIYIDIEKNLENEIGKARRPDGFVLDLSSNSFYVVEFELSNHSTYGHIDPQINGFLQAVDNWNTRQKIAGILKKYMEEDMVRLKAIKDHIGDTSELYQFFLERVLTPMHNSGQPNTYIIIDECCDELQIAMRHRTPKPKIIEAAVYAREGAEMVKALRFEPQFSFVPPVTETPTVSPSKPKQSETQPSNGEIQFPIPVYATYKGNRFEAKLFADGSMEVNGEKFKSPSGAGKAAKGGKSTNGWTFWKIKETDETIDKLYHIVKGTKKEYRSSPNDLNTIIVPAHEDGFQETFLGENSWYAIRLNKKKIPNLKYIAVYRKAPVSAITHLAEIDRIEKYKDTGKFIVFFKGKAKEIEHIKRIEGGFAPQGPVFTNREKLSKAKSTDEVL